MRDYGLGDLWVDNIEDVWPPEKITKENDALRRSIPCVKKNNALRITDGVRSMGSEAVRRILQRVKTYKKFTKDDAPYGHRNFGWFLYNKKKIFWTIDDYCGEDGDDLILTVMLADEW